MNFCWKWYNKMYYNPIVITFLYFKTCDSTYYFDIPVRRSLWLFGVVSDYVTALANL